MPVLRASSGSSKASSLVLLCYKNINKIQFYLQFEIDFMLGAPKLKNALT